MHVTIIGILTACLKGVDEELPIDPSFFRPASDFDFEEHLREERAKLARHKLRSRAIMAVAALAFALFLAAAVWAGLNPDAGFTIGTP